MDVVVVVPTTSHNTYIVININYFRNNKTNIKNEKKKIYSNS